MNQGAETQPTPIPGAWVHRVLPLFSILVVTGIVFAKIRGYGLMGYDSYPLILTARIESLADLWGTFTETLMDGRYTGDYYRPLLNLSFATDYAMWGERAWGYQLTGALLFGATAWALWLVTIPLFGKRARVGALVTLLFFLLHDSHFEVVPVPARRPELLCALFVCLALYAQLGRRQLARRWPILPAVLMLGAAASKETGYVMPALACLAVFLYSPEGSTRARWHHALRAGLCHAVAIGGLLGLRVLALGGMGGPAPLPPGFEGPGALELSRTLFTRLLAPQNFIEWRVGLVYLGLFVLAIVVAAALVSWRDESKTPRVAAVPSGPRKAVSLSATWILLVGGLYGISRSIEQWYLFLPVVGLSLFLGAGVELLLQAWRMGGAARRSLTAIGCSALGAFACFSLRYSPIYHDYPEWGLATEASDEFFDKLAQRIEATPPGQHVKAPPLPMWYPPAESGPSLRGAAILEMYSVQAWAELHYPERKLRVINRPPTTPFASDESAIQLLRPLKF